MSALELTIKGDIEVLRRLQPGDVIVVTPKNRITHEMARGLRKQVEELLGHKAVVACDLAISVTRKGDPE